MNVKELKRQLANVKDDTRVVLFNGHAPSLNLQMHPQKQHELVLVINRRIDTEA